MIADVRRQLIGTLSKGYRQRVGLAGALIHKPPVLILDEPTVGLDPRQIVKVRELIAELGRDHTVILSTHILPEVEQVCRRVLIIDNGKIVADGTPDSLRSGLAGAAELSVQLEAPDGEAREALAALAGATGVRATATGASASPSRAAPTCAATCSPSLSRRGGCSSSSPRRCRRSRTCSSA